MTGTTKFATQLFRNISKRKMARKNNKSIWSYLFWGSKSASVVLKNLPYVLFLSFLLVVYIANVHLAEAQVRRIQVLQKDVSALKRHYTALKSDIAYHSQLSEIAADVRYLGLRKMPGRVKRVMLED